MASSKKPKTKVVGRGKPAVSVPTTDKHKEQCSVCKHPMLKEIEARYLAFETEREVAAAYGLTDDAVGRHARYYGLNRQRLQDTESALESVIERGMLQVKDIPITTVLDAIKELNKVRGKHQSDKRNDADVARDEENKRWAEQQIADYMRDFGASREQAIEEMRRLAPTVSKWIH